MQSYLNFIHFSFLFSFYWSHQETTWKKKTWGPVALNKIASFFQDSASSLDFVLITSENNLKNLTSLFSQIHEKSTYKDYKWFKKTERV